MKHKLPIISLMAAALVVTYVARRLKSDARSANRHPPVTNRATSPASGPALEDGNALVARAAEAVAQIENVSGQVRQRTQLFGRQLASVGKYRQWFDGRSLRFRFDLRTQVGRETAHFMQLGDGRFVWTRRELPSGKKLQRVDRKLLERELAVIRRSDRQPTYPLDVLALSNGLADVLDRLRWQFDFQPPENSTIGREKLPVYVVRGGWNRAALRRHFPQIADNVLAGKLRGFPETLPTHVELVLGRGGVLPLFPYRISLLRKEHSGTVRLMDLEFFALSHEEPIRPDDFRYDPGGQPIEDATEEVLKRLSHNALPQATRPTPERGAAGFVTGL